MKLKNNLKPLIFSQGYKSVRDFCAKTGLVYDHVNRLANGSSKSIDKELLILLCEKLECNVVDLFEVEKGQAS